MDPWEIGAGTLQIAGAGTGSQDEPLIRQNPVVGQHDSTGIAVDGNRMGLLHGDALLNEE